MSNWRYILDTKTALLSVFIVATLELDGGPDWWIAVKAVIRLFAVIYLLLYFWFGPEPVEKHKDGHLTAGR